MFIPKDMKNLKKPAMKKLTRKEMKSTKGGALIKPSSYTGLMGPRMSTN